MNKETEIKYYSVLTLCVLGAAIFLRLSFWPVERMWPDEALYAWTAQRVFENPQMIFSKEVMDFHPPLFTVLLSLAHFFFPPLEACRNMVFLINLVGLVAIFILGNKVRGKFLACYAMGVLGFNVLYFNMSNLILSDGAVGVFIIFFFYALARVHPQRSGIWDVALGLSIMALVLLKWSSVIVLPFLCLYYMMAFHELPLIQRALKLTIPLSMTAVLIALLMWHNYQLLGSWVPQVFSSKNELYREPFLYYLQNMHPIIFPKALIPLIVLGLWGAYKSADRNQWAHALWVVFAMTALSAMAAKDFRFLSPVIPSMVLVSGIGLQTLLSYADRWPSVQKMSRPLALGIIFVFLTVVHFQEIKENVLRKAYMYTGYQEAGELIKELSRAHPQAVVLASSPRMIRYFSGINFKEFGGQLEELPKTPEEFVRLASNTPVDMIVAVDRWEMSQPRWIYPPTDLSNQTLKSSGFNLEKRVRRSMRTSPQKLEEGSVIWIFRRPAQGN